jgi:hypothetical protein
VKKLVGILLLLVLMAASLPADESKLFVVTRHITKIYVHRLGFRVLYQKTDMDLADFYVPISWFDDADGKATLVKGTDSSYPFFSIYWEAGNFHSIRIYAKSNLADKTWGDLPHRDGIDDLFANDEIELDF